MKKASLLLFFLTAAAFLQAQILFDRHMLLPQELKNNSKLTIALNDSVQKQIREKRFSLIDRQEIKKTFYVTSEFFSPRFHDAPDFTDEDRYEVLPPVVEEKETKSYIEVTFRIPPQYEILPEVNEYGRFQDDTHNCINLFINGDFRLFKLDYNIILENPSLQKEINIGDFDEMSQNQFQNTKNAKLLTLRYSPRYFTLETNYPYERDVPNKYGFKTEVRPVFSVQRKGLYAISVYLVPNIKNIYKDFKFIKEGPSPYIYQEIIEEKENNEENFEEEPPQKPLEKFFKKIFKKL